VLTYFISAGDLNSDELERIVTIIQNPTQFKIPTWFLNRQKDIVDGKNSQILSNGVDSKLRDDLERLKKIRAHRGLRHYWGLRVRGQHTKTTGKLLLLRILRTLLYVIITLLVRTSRQDRRCVEEEELEESIHMAESEQYFVWHPLSPYMTYCNMLAMSFSCAKVKDLLMRLASFLSHSPVHCSQQMSLLRVYSNDRYIVLVLENSVF